MYSFSFAQNIDFTGVWNGKFYDNSGFSSADDMYRFEVQIAQTGKGVEGVTYSYQNTRFYGKAAHNGFIKTTGNKIVVQETKMLELKMDIGVACLMTCTMKYSKVGDVEYLEGTYTAFEENTGSPCPGGYVKLKKIKKSIFGTEPKVQRKLNEIAKRQATSNKPPIATTKPKPKPPVVVAPPKPKPPVVVAPPKPKPPVVVTPPKPKPPVVVTPPNPKPPVVVTTPPIIVVPKPIAPPPAILKERKTELVQTLPVNDTNTLVIDFYDYGEVDGDIVTIYVNNVMVVNKQTLGTKPIQVPIQLSASNPEVTVIMYADNLGSIPPNTAYMTVRINGEKYDATIESTEQKNASVKFVYKPK
jgi:hypothetical protein